MAIDLRDENDEWIRVSLQPGDMIGHLKDLSSLHDAGNYIKATDYLPANLSGHHTTERTLMKQIHRAKK